ncbi:class I SAM-dependent methyltransferase [Chryseolinea sp. H1M3-3]|uniref:class I SAM-dependent methyltransferase n=1 Tax=Chryseolinea sp. H1M3-3 TaxID=3034144 RepID=UPI0023EBE03A|nr:class I SAM-dependent methyltransferase [Chryseolinea sp. H1M3-3]
MIEVTNCPICNGKNFVPYLQCCDHSVTQETFSLIKCTKCGLVITSPRPDDLEIQKYYASSTYISHLGTAQTLLDRIYLFARSFTLRWKWSIVERNILPTLEKKILDFGCGTGEFLRTAKQHSWNVAGVEPSENARTQASPEVFNHIKSSLPNFSNQTFNVITLWHVLEHVSDLDSTIGDLKNHLTQEGTLFIAVPNHSSWDGKHYQEKWAGYDVPRHFWHFNSKNMLMLLENHSLELVEIIPMRLDAFYISLLSEKYSHNRMSAVGLIKAFFYGCFSNVNAKKNNEYSSLIYVARK